MSNGSQTPLQRVDSATKSKNFSTLQNKAASSAKKSQAIRNKSQLGFNQTH
jgi:hypothetical protein